MIKRHSEAQAERVRRDQGSQPGLLESLWLWFHGGGLGRMDFSCRIRHGELSKL